MSSSVPLFHKRMDPGDERSIMADARFRACQQLIRNGHAEDAVEVLSLLTEEASVKYGEKSIQAATAYYEYGHSLIRAQISKAAQIMEDNVQDLQQVATKKQSQRDRIAASAEQRLRINIDTTTTKDISNHDTVRTLYPNDTGIDISPQSDEGMEDDALLALELMENSWAIMNDYLSTNITSETSSKTSPNSLHIITPQWVKEQLPRILLGIGDTLSYLKRYADAIDSYTSAAQHLEDAIKEDQIKKKKKTDDDEVMNTSTSLNLLYKKRKLAETYILIAEQLLASPPNIDLVTTESKVLLVTHSETVAYAQGYYEKAKDVLQDVIYLMGKIASEGYTLDTEKEDICFLSTMVMGIGMTLEERHEFIEGKHDVSSNKKAKRR